MSKAILIAATLGAGIGAAGSYFVSADAPSRSGEISQTEATEPADMGTSGERQGTKAAVDGRQAPVNVDSADEMPPPDEGCTKKLELAEANRLALQAELDEMNFQQRDLEDTPELRRQLARDLMEVSEFEASMNEALEMVSKQFSGDAKGQQMQSAFQTVSKLILDDDFMGSVEKIYVDIYSPYELNALVRFHQSEVGQSFLQKNPEMMVKIVELMQKKITDKSPQIQEEIARQVEGKKQGGEEPPPAKL